jgi:hypothetical protein
MDHCLVMAEIRERLAVNIPHKLHVERFTLEKLNDVEGKVKYRFEVSNGFVALEDMDIEVGINTVWETVREKMNIKSRLL